MEAIRTDDWAATRAWAQAQLAAGERMDGAERLRGGWTSQMRRLHITGPRGPRALVLRSFVKPFYVRHAPNMLAREAAVLRLLAGTGVPAPGFVAVDPAGDHCDHPSLLMSALPGEVRVAPEGAAARTALLARQLVAVHGLEVAAADRPRTYEAWTAPERVRIPEQTTRPGLWQQAVDVIRREPPSYRARFLHRDFHPGNVLFSGADTDAADGTGTDNGTGELRISGVVDWVETSWGPADLDVAHCSTALALLYGVPEGLAFADAYRAAGGELAERPEDHLYWRLLDALAFAPDAEKVAVPWRELGRTDLTAEVLAGRLEDYIAAVFG
ncbi:phosphotransferase family protein [Streptomyces bambusae]|uniref:Phosphotransferase n=1 Tax=Streptomyces bambusae TaxID=1550616 RepID=A0ABS6ZDR2_9ACTN|nr:phosphotransferase [Streptomyces bambusae]MBW5485899.1 phosphotransferase [Streptomyces bambusae]